LQGQLQEGLGARNGGGNAWEDLTGKQPELARLSGELLVQCLNPFTKPVRLPAGSLVKGTTPFIKKMLAGTGNSGWGPGKHPLDQTGAVPEHVADLYQGACGGFENSSERHQLAQLL